VIARERCPVVGLGEGRDISNSVTRTDEGLVKDRLTKKCWLGKKLTTDWSVHRSVMIIVGSYSGKTYLITPRVPSIAPEPNRCSKKRKLSGRGGHGRPLETAQREVYFFMMG